MIVLNMLQNVKADYRVHIAEERLKILGTGQIAKVRLQIHAMDETGLEPRQVFGVNVGRGIALPAREPARVSSFRFRLRFREPGLAHAAGWCRPSSD